MWPNIPLRSSGGIARTGDPQCFNLYTKAVDTERNAASGFSIDPELQFTTSPNVAYWLYGYLQIRQSDRSGQPGFQGNFIHGGTTKAFQFLGASSAGFDPSSDVTGPIYWSPIDTSRLATTGYLLRTSTSDTELYHIFVDGVLAVGASGGLFGLEWGIATAAAGGKTKLLTGSYLSVLELRQP